jgi:hypothetical protein
MAAKRPVKDNAVKARCGKNKHSKLLPPAQVDRNARVN